MPSSLIFAALAAAWLVVLVPMFARRRQEVSKTTDSALAARVVRRGSDRNPRSTRAPGSERAEELGMPDTGHDEDRYEIDDYPDDDAWRPVHSDDVRAGRRYRPGRGGFDPEAAALAARVKYARRQRIVLAMLVASIGTALLAGFLLPIVWWAHGAVDLALAGYLTYLRRQVRIEEDIRRRRLARVTGGGDDEHGEYVESEETGGPEVVERPAEADEEPVRPQGTPRTSPAPAAVVVEIDDEDPMFDELDERTWEPYRRASGE